MDAILKNFESMYGYVAPFIIFVALVLGVFFVKLSKVKRCYFTWALGVGLLISGIISGIALVLFYGYMSGVKGWGAVLSVYAPLISLYLAGIGTVIIFSALSIWGFVKKDILIQKNYTGLPGSRSVTISGAILLLIIVHFLYITLPVIHLFPYTELSVERSTKTVSLYASKKLVSKKIITVHNQSGPEYEVNFHHKLNWKGEAVLDVKHIDTKTGTTSIQSYSFPFVMSSYKLEKGRPVRTD